MVCPNSPRVLNVNTILLFHLAVFRRDGYRQAGHAAHQPIGEREADGTRKAGKSGESVQRGLPGNSVTNQSGCRVRRVTVRADVAKAEESRTGGVVEDHLLVNPIVCSQLEGVVSLNPSDVG